MGFKHYKFQPNEYVFVMKNGKVIKQGIGLSFFVTHLTQECQWFLQFKTFCKAEKKNPAAVLKEFIKKYVEERENKNNEQEEKNYVD